MLGSNGIVDCSNTVKPMTEKSRCIEGFQRAAGGGNAVAGMQANGLRRATRTDGSRR